MFVDLPCLLITCYIIKTCVLQNSRPGIAHDVGKTNHCNDSKKAANAYGVQDTLNNAIMMITILVNLFCLFATISAILPVDSIVCYNIILYLFGHLAIFIRYICLQYKVTFRKLPNLPFYEGVLIQLS